MDVKKHRALKRNVFRCIASNAKFHVLFQIYGSVRTSHNVISMAHTNNNNDDISSRTLRNFLHCLGVIYSLQIDCLS